MPRYLLLILLAAIPAYFLYGFLRLVLGVEIMTIVVLIALVVFGVIVYRNLQTNRKVADATPEQRTEALAFAPVSGKAVLYVFRNQFVGRAVGVNVLIDGQDVAQIKSPRFTRLLLTPGAHRIAGYTGTNKKPADDAGTPITANAGEVLVLKCEVEPQMVGVSVKFTQQPLERVRGDIAKTRMVVADVGAV